MKVSTSFLALALILVACTSAVWVHQDKTKRLERDKQVCLEYALQHVGYPPNPSLLTRAQHQMAMAEWRQDKRRLEHACMEQLGWAQS